MRFDADKHIRECCQNALQEKGLKAKARYLVLSEASAFLGSSFDERVDALRENGFNTKEAVWIADALENTERWRLV